MEKAGASAGKKPAATHAVSVPTETWDVDKPLATEAIEAAAAGVFEWKKSSLSPYGLFHMAGNAAEWVNDYYEAELPCDPPRHMDPRGPEKGVAHVYRGGSYLSSGESELAVFTRCVPSDALSRSGSQREGAFIGFRCGKSLDIVNRPAPMGKAAGESK
jgi:formylglycine-generating enzyme required for sulfatase activity